MYADSWNHGTITGAARVVQNSLKFAFLYVKEVGADLATPDLAYAKSVQALANVSHHAPHFYIEILNSQRFNKQLLFN